MSDRTPDDQAPLFPRRGLAGPTSAQATPERAAKKAATPPPGDKPTKKAAPRKRARPAKKPTSAAATRANSTAQQGDGAGPGSGTSTSDQARGASGASEAARAGSTGTSGASHGGAPTVTMARVSEREATRPTPTGGPPAPQAPLGATPTETAPQAPAARSRQPRKARLRMVRVDPWSVMKMSFALSIALAVVLVIAVAIVWSVLDAAGVWESINTSIASLDANAGASDFDVQQYVGLPRVMGLTMLVAAADVVLLTALATLGAFMYNLAAALLGGLEVTLAEDR
jgi:hypothetical protein